MRHIILFAMALTVVSAGAQTFIPMKKGAVLEYKYYNAKGKPLRNDYRDERWLRFTVDEVWGDSVANVTVENEIFTRLLAENELLRPTIAELSYGDVIVASEGVTFDNLRWLFSPVPPVFNYYYKVDKDGSGTSRSSNAFASDGESYYRVELSAASFLPRELHVGDSLPDEEYRALFVEELSEYLRNARNKLQEFASVEHGEKLPTIFNIEDNAIIRDRRVEAFEKVSVPAGEFECWKISYELVKPMFRILGMPARYNSFHSDGPPLTTKYIDYLSPEVGLVKREKLNFRGNKVEEVMVLTTLTQ